MLRTILIAMLASLALPTLADEVFSLTVDNQSSQMIDRINTYPVNDAGEAVEDNIGGLGDIAAGSRVAYDLSVTRCMLVRVYVGMADQSEMEADIDLCADRILVVHD